MFDTCNPSNVRPICEGAVSHDKPLKSKILDIMSTPTLFQVAKVLEILDFMQKGSIQYIDDVKSGSTKDYIHPRHTLRDICHPGQDTVMWTSKLFSSVNDSVILAIIPTLTSLNARIDNFRYLQNVAVLGVGAQLFPSGSIVSSTYLPSSNTDSTIFTAKSDDESWAWRVTESVCQSSVNFTKQMIEVDNRTKSMCLSNVKIENESEVKSVKCTLNKNVVNIYANQLTSLYSQALIISLDDFIGRNHLLKRSILLVKAWCHYDSFRYTDGRGSICGAEEGRLSSWAVVVMLIWIFNMEGQSIEHPLQALGHFILFYSSFDWNKFAITVHGPVSAVDLRGLQGAELAAFKPGSFFPRELLDAYATRYESVRESSVRAHRVGSRLLGKKIGISLSSQHSSAPGSDDNRNASADTTQVPSQAIDTSLALQVSFGSPKTGLPLCGESDETKKEALGASQQHEGATVAPSKLSTEKIGANPLKGGVEHPCNWGAKLAFGDGCTYTRATVNIIDPIVQRRTVTHDMDIIGAHVMCKAFADGATALEAFCADFKSQCEREREVGREEASTSSGEGSLISLTRQFFEGTIVVAAVYSDGGGDEKDETGQDSALHSSADLLSSTGDVVQVDSALHSTAASPSEKRVMIPDDSVCNDHDDELKSAVEFDALASQMDQLEVSMKFAELVLASVVTPEATIRLIMQILAQRGPMPVGEVGKCLQVHTGSYVASRRLKDQFTGLKKLLETTKSPWLKLMRDHPFNPTVLYDPDLIASLSPSALESNSSISSELDSAALCHLPNQSSTSPCRFDHNAFAFPVLKASGIRGSNAASSGPAKHSVGAGRPIALSSAASTSVEQSSRLSHPLVMTPHQLKSAALTTGANNDRVSGGGGGGRAGPYRQRDRHRILASSSIDGYEGTSTLSRTAGGMEPAAVMNSLQSTHRGRSAGETIMTEYQARQSVHISTPPSQQAGSMVYPIQTAAYMLPNIPPISGTMSTSMIGAQGLLVLQQEPTQFEAVTGSHPQYQFAASTQAGLIDYSQMSHVGSFSAPTMYAASVAQMPGGMPSGMVGEVMVGSDPRQMHMIMNVQMQEQHRHMLYQQQLHHEQSYMEQPAQHSYGGQHPARMAVRRGDGSRQVGQTHSGGFQQAQQAQQAQPHYRRGSRTNASHSARK